MHCTDCPGRSNGSYLFSALNCSVVYCCVVQGVVVQCSALHCSVVKCIVVQYTIPTGLKIAPHFTIQSMLYLVNCFLVFSVPLYCFRTILQEANVSLPTLRPLHYFLFLGQYKRMQCSVVYQETFEATVANEYLLLPLRPGPERPVKIVYG